MSTSKPPWREALVGKSGSPTFVSYCMVSTAPRQPTMSSRYARKALQEQKHDAIETVPRLSNDV